MNSKNLEETLTVHISIPDFIKISILSYFCHIPLAILHSKAANCYYQVTNWQYCKLHIKSLHALIQGTHNHKPSTVLVTFQALFLAQSLTYSVEDAVSHHVSAPLEEDMVTYRHKHITTQRWHPIQYRERDRDRAFFFFLPETHHLLTCKALSCLKECTYKLNAVDGLMVSSGKYCLSFLYHWNWIIRTD